MVEVPGHRLPAHVKMIIHSLYLIPKKTNSIVFPLLEIKHRPMCILQKHSAIELQPQLLASIITSEPKRLNKHVITWRCQKHLSCAINSISMNNSKWHYLQSHRRSELVTGSLFLPHLLESDQANLQSYTEIQYIYMYFNALKNNCVLGFLLNFGNA
jgi:hypothetical protein